MFVHNGPDYKVWENLHKHLQWQDEFDIDGFKYIKIKQ